MDQLVRGSTGLSSEESVRSGWLSQTGSELCFGNRTESRDKKPTQRLPGEAGEEGGVDFHAAPEVAEADVFVAAVLVIIVIHDGDADDRQSEILKNVHGRT